MNENLRNKIIVALDSSNVVHQISIVKQLGDGINFYKIGLSSIASGGLGLANELKAQGKRVFIDLKLFDIGNTIEKAVHGLSQFDIDFLTVHGDPHVIKAAIKGKRNSKLKILAVTLLTSLNREDLDKSLIRTGTVENLVKRRAQIAFDSGADGIICSPNEVKRVRSLKNSTGKIIVTPGIRLAGNKSHDQKRVGDPTSTLNSGADYLVIGRPITEAKNPLKEVKTIISQMTENLKV